MPCLFARPAATLVALLVSVSSLSAEIKWLTDLDEAKKVAQAEKKDILVDFTGSDWCVWCIRLKKEVFDQKAFEVAAKDFVFVELDFPRKKKLPAEHAAKNEALAKKFAIQGFPTILLLDAQGELYAQTEYQEGGPENYLKNLAQLRKLNTPEGKRSLALRREIDLKEGELMEEIAPLIDPLLDKKDLKAAETALAGFAEVKKLEGELRTRIVGRIRVQIAVTCRKGDHDYLIKVIDEVLKDATPSSVVDDLKQLRERVVAVRDEASKNPVKK